MSVAGIASVLGARRAAREPDLVLIEWGYVIPLLVVAGAAVLIASVTRLAGVRWTMPLAALPFAAILALIDAWTGTGAAAALGGAAVLGRHWHVRDLERGGVEAEKARARRGTIATVAAARERERWSGGRVRDGRLALGETRRGEIATVPFGGGDGVRAFIPGAPGSGKTVDLALHARAYVEDGQGVAAIDPKGDPALRDELQQAALDHGRAFLEWTPQGPTTYNPLGRGNASEITDKALAGEDWTEPHYLRQAQRYLNLELQAMAAAGEWPPELGSVVAYLDAERLDALCDRLDGEVGDRVSRYLDSLSSRQRSELGGVRDRLAVLAESDLGRQLAPAYGRAEIELSAALREGAVVYFQLDSDRFALASQILGAAIVSDLVSLTGELQGRATRALVLIDEFAAVAAGEVSRLLSRSRSAGISVVLATQAFADLSLARLGDSTESLRRQVLSHVEYVVAHRQSEPEAAELLGQMAGTKPAWSVVRRANTKPLLQRSMLDWGREEVTRRRTREFVRHPDEFKRLRPGEAIVIEPSGRRPAELVRVWPAERGVAGGRGGDHGIRSLVGRLGGRGRNRGSRDV